MQPPVKPIADLRKSLRLDRILLGALTALRLLAATPLRQPKLLFFTAFLTCLPFCFNWLPPLRSALDYCLALMASTEVFLGLYMAFNIGGDFLSWAQGKLTASKQAIQCRLDETLMELNQRNSEALAIDERASLLRSARPASPVQSNAPNRRRL